MKKSILVLALLVSTIAQAQITGGKGLPGGAIPLPGGSPGGFPVLTPVQAQLGRVYNTAAYNLVLNLKSQFDSNSVTNQICSSNPEDAGVASADLVNAFTQDTIIPAAEKMFITRNGKISCLGYPTGGLNEVLAKTCAAVRADANFTLTPAQKSLLSAQVDKTLNCMHLE